MREGMNEGTGLTDLRAHVLMVRHVDTHIGACLQTHLFTCVEVHGDMHTHTPRQTCPGPGLSGWL